MKTRIPRISVRKGREWQIRRGHPWLFSGAISQEPKGVRPGALVDLVDVDGKFIARGYYNPECDIAVRVLTFKEEEIDREFLRQRLKQAVALRSGYFTDGRTSTYRLVNAEGDFLPGFIVDYLSGVVVVQSHTAGADLLLGDFLEVLKEEVSPSAIVVRNDASVRRREGVPIEEPRVVHGTIPEVVTVKENGFDFATDPTGGQKTGYYTDQRDKREKMSAYCKGLRQGARLANCFSYSGSFSVYALSACSGLHTINIDQSGAALELARRNYELNNIDHTQHEFVEDDAFAWLDSQQNREKFDVVILDPPAFAKSKKDTEKALKAYARLNRAGVNCVAGGGLLVTCSCSGTVTMEDFEQSVREAAASCRRRIQLLDTFTHGADHPVNIALPETRYLKVLFCRVLD